MSETGSDLAHTPRSLRARLDLTQGEVASRAGVSVPTVSAIEDGDQGATTETLRKVAAALQCEFLVLAEAYERVRARKAAESAA